MWGPFQHARIVDDGVRGAAPVHLVGEVAGLRHVREVTNDAHRAAVNQALHRAQTPFAACVHDDLVAGVQQGLRRGQPEAVGGAGDKNAGHLSSFLRPAILTLTRS